MLINFTVISIYEFIDFLHYASLFYLDWSLFLELSLIILV